MACGAPTITTAISAMGDQIGEAGLLVPPDDLDALTQAMLKILTHAELRAHLAAAGPVQAAKFTWQQTAIQTREVYKKVLRR